MKHVQEKRSWSNKIVEWDQTDKHTNICQKYLSVQSSLNRGEKYSRRILCEYWPSKWCHLTDLYLVSYFASNFSITSTMSSMSSWTLACRDQWQKNSTSLQVPLEQCYQSQVWSSLVFHKSLVHLRMKTGEYSTLVIQNVLPECVLHPEQQGASKYISCSFHHTTWR